MVPTSPMTPGLVVVADHEQRAVDERRFDVDAVELRQPRAVTGSNDRAFDPALAVGRLQLHRQHVGEVARPRAARLDDLDAAFGGDRARVDDGDARREHRPQHAGDDRAGDQVRRARVTSGP